jgi:hypothetical protein
LDERVKVNKKYTSEIIHKHNVYFEWRYDVQFIYVVTLKTIRDAFGVSCCEWENIKRTLR